MHNVVERPNGARRASVDRWESRHDGDRGETRLARPDQGGPDAEDRVGADRDQQQPFPPRPGVPQDGDG